MTFDTNVFISALVWDGPPRQLLRMAEAGAFRLQVSQPILDETARVLAERFHWPQEDTAEARDLLSSIGQRVVPHITLNICRDPDDDRILECSQASRSDYLVTGDKDLLVLKQHAGARILKPADFLALVQQRGR
ncbi:MAG: uncharacterized protein QOJ99_3037 [Bryobacterales bacterium]|nr:uncharacterized protein [Bryobacterales bacterium]